MGAVIWRQRGRKPLQRAGVVSMRVLPSRASRGARRFFMHVMPEQACLSKGGRYPYMGDLDACLCENDVHYVF